MQSNGSPDDPIFFMHHTNIDRIFHIWANCWGYDQIDPSALTSTQYCEINPTGKDTSKTVYQNPGGSPLVKLPIPVDTTIPYNWQATGDSKIFPKASWPKIRDVWTCGTATQPGWNGMYYRYGPDKMAQSLTKSCNKTSSWNWVNYGASSKKRDNKPAEEDNETRVYREINEALKKKEEQGLSPQASIRELAMENCLLVPKLELTKERMAWLRMMGISPSSLDRICDEPSKDPNYDYHNRAM